MALREIDLKTIGFTRSTAERFFNRLIQADVARVIDVRLNNTSQLSGFAKAKDLSYFLAVINNIDYVHEPLLAPTQEIFTEFKKLKGEWAVYERKFLDLMDRRKIDEKLSPNMFHKGCLLCSEAEPHHCHRRLIAAYLQDRWTLPIKVEHL